MLLIACIILRHAICFWHSILLLPLPQQPEKRLREEIFLCVGRENQLMLMLPTSTSILSLKFIGNFKQAAAVFS